MCVGVCVVSFTVKRQLGISYRLTATPAGVWCDFCLNISVLHPLTGLNTDPQLSPGIHQTPPSSPGSSCMSAGTDSGCSQEVVRYFSVMWCKASKKKHKRWEGDAVLVTRGRTATLKDMEGKDIGKGENSYTVV